MGDSTPVTPSSTPHGLCHVICFLPSRSCSSHIRPCLSFTISLGSTVIPILFRLFYSSLVRHTCTHLYWKDTKLVRLVIVFAFLIYFMCFFGFFLYDCLLCLAWGSLGHGWWDLGGLG